MNILMDVLFNPAFWLVASVLCAIGAVRNWKNEGSVMLLRAFFVTALFLNASLYGVTVVTYELTHGQSYFETVFNNE